MKCCSNNDCLTYHFLERIKEFRCNCDWIPASAGMQPTSELIVIKRKDGTYDLGYFDLKSFKYLDKESNPVNEGNHLMYWFGIPKMED